MSDDRLGEILTKLIASCPGAQHVSLTLDERNRTITATWPDPAGIGRTPVPPVTSVYRGEISMKPIVKWFEDECQARVYLDRQLSKCFAFTRTSGVVPLAVRERMLERMVTEYGRDWYESNMAVADMISWFNAYARNHARCPKCGVPESLEGNLLQGFSCLRCSAEWVCRDPLTAHWD